MKTHIYWIGILAAIGLGSFFVVAGMGKLLVQSSSYEPFLAPSFLKPDMVATLYNILPYGEILIGLLLFAGVATRLAVFVSLALIASFMASNFYLLSIGIGTCGSCFGVAGALSVYSALVIDGLMFALAIVSLICYQGRTVNIYPWFIETGHTAAKSA